MTGRASYGIGPDTGKPRSNLNPDAAGFTLLELVIVMVLAAILVALGVPSYQTMMQDSRRDSAVQDFVADLAFARSEALRRNTTITLCRSSDGTACATSGDGYQRGWIVFPDGTNTGTHATDGSEPVLRRHDAIGDNVTLNSSSNTLNRVTFNATLRTTNGTIVVCDARGATYGRNIVVDTVGRTRTDASVSTCTP